MGSNADDQRGQTKMKQPIDYVGISSGEVGDFTLRWDNRNSLWHASILPSVLDYEVAGCLSELRIGKLFTGSQQHGKVFGNSALSKKAIDRYLELRRKRIELSENLDIKNIDIEGLSFHKSRIGVTISGFLSDEYKSKVSDKTKIKYIKKHCIYVVKYDSFREVYDDMLSASLLIREYKKIILKQPKWCSLSIKNFTVILSGRLIVTEGHKIPVAYGIYPSSCYDNVLQADAKNYKIISSSINDIEEDIIEYIESHEWEQKKQFLEYKIHNFNQKHIGILELILSDVWILMKSIYGTISISDITELGWRYCYMDTAFIVNSMDKDKGEIERMIDHVFPIQRENHD